VKVKKFIPLLVGLIVIWGAYVLFMLYLAHGGIYADVFAGAPLKTMKYAFGVVSILLSIFWGVIWWFLHVKSD